MNNYSIFNIDRNELISTLINITFNVYFINHNNNAYIKKIERL